MYEEEPTNKNKLFEDKKGQWKYKDKYPDAFDGHTTSEGSLFGEYGLNVMRLVNLKNSPHMTAKHGIMIYQALKEKNNCSDLTLNLEGIGGFGYDPIITLLWLLETREGMDAKTAIFNIKLKNSGVHGLDTFTNTLSYFEKLNPLIKERREAFDINKG